MNDPIEAAYAAAVGAWTTAEFTHEADDHTYERASYCDGDDPSCSTCRSCALDAAAAERAAYRAIMAYRAGRRAEAADLAAEAADTERNWGDAPTWGAFAELIAT